MLWWAYLAVAFLASVSAKNDILEIVPTDFSADDEVLSTISDNIARRFEKEYMDFLRTGIESPALRQLSEELANAHSKKDIFTKDIQDLDRADQFVVCTTCRATAKVVFDTFQEGGELSGPDAEDHAKRIMLDMCVRFNLQTVEVCSGLFDSNWPTMNYILQTTEMDSRSFCWLFMEFNMCASKNPDYDFQLTLDTSVAAPSAPKSEVPKSGSDDVVILHLTDIHHDPLYEAGSLAECDEPLCCQRNKSISEGTSKAAGYWGDYRDCDAPWQLIENALAHIKKTHPKIDYIYQTGDVVDHMVWATSVEKNNEVLTKVTNAIAKTFPGVPVYSCIGNHEPHPLNVFSPEDVPQDISTKWLYEHLYNDWSEWLPADAKATMLKGGYYTVSPKAGFRVIALNSNDCYNMNWWLFYKGSDKIPQLQWLHDTLLAAEKQAEYVHIITHIPSGDGSCWNTWSREYNRIVERFSATISGIFTGHSHKDEMNVHYSSKGHAVAITWNGGALTTFSWKNPNYRLYHAEKEKMQVVEHETWIFNLTEANEKGKDVEPNWFKEYQFTTEFTTDLSPAGIDKLLDEFAANPSKLHKFWQYKMTTADPAIKNGCGRGCLLGTICRLATTVNNQRTRCLELQAKLSQSLDDETSSTGSTASPTPTAGPTEGPTSDGPTPTQETTTKDPGTDGAGSLISMQLATLLGMLAFLKFLL